VTLSNAIKKAELIQAGEIYIPRDVILPCFPSRSASGPDAGTPSLVFSFENMHLKLCINRRKKLDFALRKKDPTKNIFQIYRKGNLYLDNVRIIPILLHAPNQAFVNIEDKCVYDCKFCVINEMETPRKKCHDDKDLLALLLKASKENSFESIAITSGVSTTPWKTIDHMVQIIEEVKDTLGDVHIGVEPYTTNTTDIDKLKSAGATELKLNIQTYDRSIFKKICPELDYDGILNALKYGANIFGRNRVCSNIIVGLGETDKNVLGGVEQLAKFGAVATIRGIRVSEHNRKKLSNALGHEVVNADGKRLVHLALEQKKILEKHRLTTRVFKTMCHKCGCCDIVPGLDV
jgi:biotin synthase-related radical SAM superfamily protein